MERIKTTQVAVVRAEQLRKQGGVCALCREEVALDEAVLDHCHTTGLLRGVLHRGCNAMLGHIENNSARHKLLRTTKLSAFLWGIIPYINNPPMQGLGLLHPTHRTDEEKRLLRNKRARVARARTKETQ